jgi:hypothetical protein
MTRSQYDDLREQVQHGRRAVQFEGRSASTVAELDWIATAVYGLKLGGATTKAEPVKAPDQPKGSDTPKDDAKGKDEEGGRPPELNLKRANLDTLRAVATERGIEFPADATRGQLLDLISKAEKAG